MTWYPRGHRPAIKPEPWFVLTLSPDGAPVAFDDFDVFHKAHKALLAKREGGERVELFAAHEVAHALAAIIAARQLSEAAA